MTNENKEPSKMTENEEQLLLCTKKDGGPIFCDHLGGMRCYRPDENRKVVCCEVITPGKETKDDGDQKLESYKDDTSKAE